MPIFEYKCKKCGHDFEEFVTAGKKVKCPKCGDQKVVKKFSTFACTGTDVNSLVSSGCSSCSSSNCSSCEK